MNPKKIFGSVLKIIKPDILIYDFVTHCGWNWILEAMTYGVPVIGMPMKLEHPMNSRLTIELGIGVEVGRDGDELTRGEIGKAIKKVLEGEDGKRMERNDVDELSSEVKRKRYVEMNVVVKKLVQLARAW